MNIKFTYIGQVYDNYDKLIKSNIELSTTATSAKQALNNIIYKIKSKYSLERYKIYLTGKLYFDAFVYNIINNNIEYTNQDEMDEYTELLSSGKYKLNKNFTKPYYAKLYKEFGIGIFTREEFLLFLFNLKEDKVKFSQQNGSIQLSLFDYVELTPVSNDTFSNDNNEWIFDPEEGVYWKDGVKYGEYLIVE